jgi:membrane-anchored protein YejM (alkaline phosphatase superfamily)
MIREKFRKIFSSGVFFSFTVPLILTNTLISLIIALPLVRSFFEQANWSGTFTRGIPYVSHFFLLNLIIGILSYIAARLFSRWLAAVLSFILFALFQVILFMDTKIYSIFHYHINGLVLNVLTTQGAADSILLGRGTVHDLLFTILILFLSVFASCIFALKAASLYGPKAAFMRKSLRFLFLVGLCLVFADKGLYAYGDLVNNTRITSNSRILPLYQPFTIKRFARNVLGIKVDREENFQVQGNGTVLHYPKAPLQFAHSADRKYNILLVVIDGLRFDMLDPEVMPNVWDFSRDSVIFRNHYSGGNGTRFGIFTLLYGIHGTYWHTFLANRVPPVLIDTLIDAGYDFKIFSSTSLTFPEFRKTAFLRIPEGITDSFDSDLDIRGRDRAITDQFIEYLKLRNDGSPFFAFLYYNSSHQPFVYPKDFEKFRPVASREINYFKDVNRDKVHLLRNKYKNSIFYSDHLSGMVIDALRSKGILKNTIVIITGDHGEEFYENGFLGHTSAFTDYQLRTVFVMHHPESSHLSINRMTSHLDLVPTLMETLGCLSPYEYYTHGLPLLGEHGHRFVTAANWDSAAMIDEDRITVFSTEMHALTRLEIRSGPDYSLVEDRKDVLRHERKDLLRLAEEMSDFYR